MKSLYLAVLFFACSSLIYSQNEFANGDFEQNSYGDTGDQINGNQELINLGMDGVYSAGEEPNIDMITTDVYEGGPQSGNWFVGITGGGTDILALRVDEPFVMGEEYTVVYYDKKHSDFDAHPITFGISNDDLDFGTETYTSSDIPVDGEWTMRSATFVATADGEHLMIKTVAGGTQDWTHLDNFSFGVPQSVNDIEKENIAIYPNPADNFIFLDNSNSEIAEFRVYNLIGQVVLEYFDLSSTSLKIDLSSLETGNYIIETKKSADQSINRTRFVKK